MESPLHQLAPHTSRLLAEKALLHGLELDYTDPGKTVYGHRDYSTTACPGNSLYSALHGIVGIEDVGGDVPTNSAEWMRRQGLGGNIDTAYQNTQTQLAAYDDIRLKLNFVDTTLTAAQMADLLPANSGIESITYLLSGWGGYSIDQ